MFQPFELEYVKWIAAELLHKVPAGDAHNLWKYVTGKVLEAVTQDYPAGWGHDITEEELVRWGFQKNHFDKYVVTFKLDVPVALQCMFHDGRSTCWEIAEVYEHNTVVQPIPRQMRPRRMIDVHTIMLQLAKQAADFAAKQQTQEPPCDS